VANTTRDERLRTRRALAFVGMKCANAGTHGGMNATSNDILRQSRSFVADQLDAQATRFGSQLTSTADDLRRIAAELDESSTVSGGAALATRGADALASAGSYLQSADGERLIVDLETFARNRPWAFAAAALAAGFAGSRLLKTSSARRYRTSTFDGD